MTDLTQFARLDSSLLHAQLLAGARQVGGIYQLDYQHALISTDDKWKADAGGIPLHSFLLATVMPIDGVGDREDEEVLLLRVDDTCQLPRGAELVEVREFAMRQLLTDGNLTVDVLTQQEMQRSGLKCRILGTFYQTDLPEGRFLLDFGADIDNLYATSRYKVYKPAPAALALVASYPQLTEDELRTGSVPHLLEIGTVRYSSTRRRAREHHEAQIPVQVRVTDFIEMKTAVFGMTRMGKSNTMKTLAVATYRHAKRIGEPIGQLLFDPQGEYANPNSQDDDTALAQLGDDVVIYRLGARSNEGGVRPLQINFYDPKQIDAAQELIGSVLSGEGKGEYVNNFIAAELGDPQPDEAGHVNYARKVRSARARFCFYALLAKAGFYAPVGHQYATVMDKTLVDGFNVYAHENELGFTITSAGGRGEVYVTGPEQLQSVVDWLMDTRENEIQESKDNKDPKGKKAGPASKWLDDRSVDAVLALYAPTGGRLGWRYLGRVKPFHSYRAGEDYANRIYQDLIAGQLVIIDLSRGTEQVLQLLSERVINHLLGRATDRFVSGQDLHRIQIVIEEAHRLFDRKAYDSASPNPYVRLAKEAAKLKIGLIYATQEVTAVAPAVLANTSNWIVAHLNNSDEIRTLSKYYDFKSFESDILSAEDRGFVRIKTRSGKYVVPVQVLKFDRAMINEARVEASLAPLSPQQRAGR